MWTTQQDYAERNQMKHYAKKHRREFLSCFANLKELCKVLNGGITIQQAEAGLGFFSSEGGDVYRIAQSGVAHAKETRLYVLVALVGTCVYVLTIGDKDTQKRDLHRCREIAANIKKALEENNEQRTNEGESEPGQHG